MWDRASITTLAAAVALATPAAARADYTKVVTGTRAVEGAKDIGNPNACTVSAFYRWTDVPGTIKAEVAWRYTDGRSDSFTDGPPFSDALAEFPAGGGKHQLQVGYFRSLGDGTLCDAAKVTELQAGFRPTAKVTLTLNECGGVGDAIEGLSRQIAAQRRQASWATDFKKTLGEIRATERKQVARHKARNEDDALRDLQKALSRLGGKKPSRGAMGEAARGLQRSIAVLKTNPPQADLKVLRQRSREAAAQRRALAQLQALRIGKKAAKRRLTRTSAERRLFARKRAKVCKRS